MSKIDAKNRIAIPNDLLSTLNTNFNSTLALYVKRKQIFLDNPSIENYCLPCLGRITIGKNNRFIIPQMARSIFNIHSGDEISFYIFEGKLAFKRIFVAKK